MEMLPRLLRRSSSAPDGDWEGGFSIIELMTVLVVAAVLVTLMAPSLRDLVLDNRRTAAVNALIGSLQDARIESVKRLQNVVLCKSTDGASCSTDGAVTWRTGWLIFVDSDADGTLDAGEVIVRKENAISGDTTATFTGNGNVVDRVSYQPSGTATNGTITYCDTRGAGKARAVIISGNGRPRASNSSDVLTCP